MCIPEVKEKKNKYLGQEEDIACLIADALFSFIMDSQRKESENEQDNIR